MGQAPPVENSPMAGASHGSVGDRLVGIDLARGLVVFGMYAAHLGPDPGEGGLVGFLMELTHRPFAVLAGFSMLLITGRKAPKSGIAGARVAIRALVLLALGSILVYLGTQVLIVLPYYGICFLLVLPLCQLSAEPLGFLAAATALVLPQLRFHLASMFGSEKSYFRSGVRAYGQRHLSRDNLGSFRDRRHCHCAP